MKVKSMCSVVVGLRKIRRDILRKHHGFKIVNKLNKGDTFGELALICNIKRTSTVVCLKDSEFIVLD